MDKKLNKELIFKTIDSIERKTGIMAHHDHRIKNKLKKWQDGELKDSYFKLSLDKLLDELNK